jgi:hypothetical protein
MARVHDIGEPRYRIERVLPPSTGSLVMGRADTVTLLPPAPRGLFTAYELAVFFNQPENTGLLYHVVTM